MKIEIKGNKTIIEETDDSPAVLMDLDTKQLIFEGPSFPEDAVETYKPIIDWLNSNNDKIDKLECIFDYTILSSASNKMVFEILVKLENMYKQGKDIHVKWFYASYDEDMKDEGKGFKENLKIPFELVEK
jgi:hypothetical protein